MPINIGQARAKAAWEFAKLKKQGGKTNDKYKTAVEKFPMLIKTNGLVNAMAFAQSKPDWKPLYEDLEKYFKCSEADKSDPNETLKNQFRDGKGLIQVLIDLTDENNLRMATAETFALFTWLKRFC